MRMRGSGKSIIDGLWEAEESADSPPTRVMEWVSWEK